MTQNITYINNLNKYKVKPTLALFLKEMATTPKNIHSKKAIRIYDSLEMF